MNTDKLNHLEDLHYKCRSLIQEARQAEFERRTRAYNLKHNPTIKNCPELVFTYETGIQYYADKRDRFISDYTETLQQVLAMGMVAKPEQNLVAEFIEAEHA